MKASSFKSIANLYYNKKSTINKVSFSQYIDELKALTSDIVSSASLPIFSIY